MQSFTRHQICIRHVANLWLGRHVAVPVVHACFRHLYHASFSIFLPPRCLLRVFRYLYCHDGSSAIHRKHSPRDTAWSFSSCYHLRTSYGAMSAAQEMWHFYLQAGACRAGVSTCAFHVLVEPCPHQIGFDQRVPFRPCYLHSVHGGESH